MCLNLLRKLASYVASTVRHTTAIKVSWQDASGCTMTLKGEAFLPIYWHIFFQHKPSHLIINVHVLFTRCRILKQLYSDGSAYKDYDLVVVGHSLGGGCAQVLSLMLRPSFPSLRCFAYEPPVRIITYSLPVG
jgi:hypothetical protein